MHKTNGEAAIAGCKFLSKVIEDTSPTGGRDSLTKFLQELPIEEAKGRFGELTAVMEVAETLLTALSIELIVRDPATRAIADEMRRELKTRGLS